MARWWRNILPRWRAAAVKKEEEARAPTINNMRGGLLYYLVRGGGASSSGTRMAVDKAASEEEHRERRNTVRHSTFATLASDWVRVNPDPALAWAEDRFTTTAPTSAHRRRQISDQLYMIRLTESEHATRAVAGKGKRNGLAAWARVHA